MTPPPQPQQQPRNYHPFFDIINQFTGYNPADNGPPPPPGPPPGFGHRGRGGRHGSGSCRGGGPGRRHDSHRPPPPPSGWGTQLVHISPFVYEGDAASAPVDVYDSAKQLTIVASVPGAAQSGIEVDYDAKERQLSLSAVVSDDENSDENLIYGERAKHLVERTITLTDKMPPIDDTKIGAILKNGSLTVTIPKRHVDAPEKRRVPVTVVDGEHHGDDTQTLNSEKAPESLMDDDEAMTVETDSVMVEKDDLYTPKLD